MQAEFDREIGNVGQVPTAAQKMRLYLVDEIVSALNNLVLFDLASWDKMPGWYCRAVESCDATMNSIQDILKEG
jgi:hypothetical protein